MISDNKVYIHTKKSVTPSRLIKLYLLYDFCVNIGPAKHIIVGKTSPFLKQIGDHNNKAPVQYNAFL